MVIQRLNVNNEENNLKSHFRGRIWKFKIYPEKIIFQKHLWQISFFKNITKKNKLVYIYLLKIPNGVPYSRKVSAENISAKKLSLKIFNISVKYFGQTFSSKKWILLMETKGTEYT